MTNFTIATIIFDDVFEISWSDNYTRLWFGLLLSRVLHERTHLMACRALILCISAADTVMCSPSFPFTFSFLSLSIGAKIDEYTLGSLDRFFFLTELIFPLAMINHPLLERYVYFCHREMSSVAINLTCGPIINLDFWQLINLFLRNYWGCCLLRLYWRLSCL